MSVLIGHASIDENGKAHGGRAGDQTGKEVCVRSWYKNGWSVVLRPKDPATAEKMARFCEAVCANPLVGYDQWQRNTLRDRAREAGWDGAKIDTGCETDCSAFMTVCAEAAGVNVSCCYLSLGNGQWNAPVTSTMRAKFKATGAFEVLTDSKYLTTDKYLKRGDVLVKETAHTVMALTDGELAGGDGSTAAPVQTTTPATAAEIKVGDLVQFTGGTYYTQANGSVGYVVKAGPAKVTLIAKGTKHPYHLIHTDKTSQVYGWVDAADIRTGSTGSGKTYTVVAGDTLWGIARRYGTTVDKLRELNGITGSLIYPGDVLRVA